MASQLSTQAAAALYAQGRLLWTGTLHSERRIPIPWTSTSRDVTSIDGLWHEEDTRQRKSQWYSIGRIPRAWNYEHHIEGCFRRSKDIANWQLPLRSRSGTVSPAPLSTAFSSMFRLRVPSRRLLKFVFSATLPRQYYCIGPQQAYAKINDRDVRWRFSCLRSSYIQHNMDPTIDESHHGRDHQTRCRCP